MAVRVVTDSTADLPPALAQELGITVVPLNVHFGTDVYRDGVDITADQFYAMLVSSPNLPTTSQPSVGDFLETYESLSEDSDGIVSIHVSGKLSGTLNSAEQARQQMQGGTRVETVDSLQASLGLAMVVIAAARAAQSGGDVDDVLRAAKEATVRAGFFGLLDTLRYLEKGGRIGKAQAFMGSLLQVKPLLTIRDGEAHPLERARNRSRGTRRLYEIAREHAPLADLAVAYTTTPDEAHALAERLRPLHPTGNVFVSQLGPVVGTYLGPQVLGVALLTRG